MMTANRSSIKLLLIALALVMPAAFATPMLGQEAKEAQAQSTGLPDDWSFHHLVFSNPGTREDAVNHGKLDQWLKITGDRRYQLQLMKRNSQQQLPAGALDTAKTKKEPLKKDWSQNMGTGTAASLTSTVGTLSSGSISNSSTLTVDSVTFDASPTADATLTGSFTSPGTFSAGQTVTITNASTNTLTLTAVASSAGTGTVTFGNTGNPSVNNTITIAGTVYTWVTSASAAYQITINTSSGSSGRDHNAQNLEAAINGNPGECYTTNCITSGTTANPSVTATVNGTVVTVTNTTTGSVTWSVGGSGNPESLAPTGSIPAATSNGCSSSTAGTLIIGTSTSTSATNLATAIFNCNAAYPAVGVSATSSSAVVTVTADAFGADGNSIVLAESLNNFTWAGASPHNLTGGSDGTTSGTSSPPTFAYWSGNTYLTSAQVASNIATAVNNNPTLQTPSTGVSATSSGANVTIAANAAGSGGNSYAVSDSGFSAFSGTGNLSGGTTATVQPNAYPAKYGASLTAASCNDFVIYPTGQGGASSAANIIAYKNIYSGCSGTVPLVYWAYNTGGAASTSPILSFDGTQVAYIQSSSAGVASLVILKMAGSGGTLGSPASITSEAAGSYRTCTAPCYTAIPFNDGDNDTFSSPFYDYVGDAAYVGDDSGKLHKITGVFNGTPTIDPSGFPVNLGTNKLSSPVFDPTYLSGEVFVGDLGGLLYCVNPSTGSLIGTSPSLGTAIADAPLINSSANYVIAFADSSSSNSVYGFSEQFFPGGEGGPVSVGTGGAGYYLYAGTFDNLYYESSNGTGNIYVLGNTGVTTGATLYRVGLSGGFLTGAATEAVTGLTANGAHPWPSPVTEFCNNGTSACALLSQTASGCTLNSSSTTITCGANSFTSSDVGASVTGTDIPPNATITTVSSATKIIISAPPSATTSGVTLTLGATSSGTDYLFFSVNQGTPSGCTDSAGHGCILAYNASYPGSVSEAGSGLGVTTPGTNGCWATGGLIIDNSAPSGTLAGASQVYFVNLDGNAAGNSSEVTSSGCTSPGAASVLDAVQAAQSGP